MTGDFVFMGYRFEVERVERDGRTYLRYTALDPDTPFDVVAVLHKMATENVACYLKRFTPLADPKSCE